MYQNIDKSEKIYLYDVYQGAYVKMFPTKLDALKFLASKREKLDWCKEDRNVYLDNINMGNDKQISYVQKYYVDIEGKYHYFHEEELVDRQYIFVDGLDRIIDFRIYKKEIEYLAKQGIFDYNSYPEKKKSKYSYYRFVRNNYKFRQEPVPFTGKKYRGKYYRIPKLHNLYKQTSDVEYKDFVRAKRNLNNLPNIYWDDAPLRSRANSKSWKDCSKKRKQWM